MARAAPHAPSLAELQGWLRWVFTDPRGVTAALDDPSGEPDSCGLSFIVEAPPIPKEARLHIYAEAYYARLLDALATSFPALYRVMGEDSFRSLVSAYLEVYPSTFTSIDNVGCHLAAFLRGCELADEVAFLPDLASLEWAVVAAFYADDWPPLDTSDLQSVPPTAWNNARIQLDPSVHLLQSAWPVHDIWAARNLPDGEFPAEVESRPCSLLVYRFEDTVRVVPGEPEQIAALQLMGQGLPLQAICEEIAGQADSQAAMPPIMAWFAEWVGAGIIRRIEFAGG